MTSDTSEKQFRIPKTVAPVVCHTISEQAILGEVFLDVTGRCSPKHIQEFFDDDSAFFPIRTSQSQRPLLLSKNIVVVVEFVSSVSQLQQDSSLILSDRKKAILDVQGLGSIQCEILIDSPADRSRVLDVFNQSKRFVAIVWNDTYTLVNTSHVFRIVEL